MARLTRPDFRMTSREEAELRRRRQRLALARFRAWKRLVRERSDLGLRHAKATDAELARCGVDLDRIYGALSASARRDFRRHAARMRIRRPGRPALRRPNQAVYYGLGAGSDFPPFDYDDRWAWSQGDAHVLIGADRQAGYLEVACWSGFGPQMGAQGNATIGFWYIPAPQAVGRTLNVYTALGTTRSTEDIHAISVHYSTCSGHADAGLTLWPFDTSANTFDQAHSVWTDSTLFDFTIWASNGYVRQITEPVNLSASIIIAPQRAYLATLTLNAFLLTQNLAGVNLDVKVAVGAFYFQTM